MHTAGRCDVYQRSTSPTIVLNAVSASAALKRAHMTVAKIIGNDSDGRSEASPRQRIASSTY